MAGILQIRVAFRLGIDDSLPTVEDPVLSDSDSGLKRGKCVSAFYCRFFAIIDEKFNLIRE